MTTGVVPAGYPELRSSAAALELPRSVVSVWGPDAESYLQGQCSQDVAALATGEGADALLLSPQGKIDAVVRVTRTGDDRFVLDTDGPADEVVARLARFRLRVKVDIEPLPGWRCVAVRGPEAAGAVVADGERFVVPVEWPGLTGVDILGPAGEDGDPHSWIDPSVVRCEPGAWEAARIEAGIPAWDREVTPATIAAEVGLVERTVSFTKGCFTGQELVARLDARGSKVARRLCGVVVDGGPTGGADPADLVGAEVTTADGEHAAGLLTSVAWSPELGATVALAVLHRRVTPPEAVVVAWGPEGDRRTAAAEARPLPLVG